MHMYVTKLEKYDISRVIELSHQLGLCIWSELSLQQELQNKDSIMLKLCKGESIIGFSAGRTVDDRVIELFNIGVEIDRQGNGSGQMLFDEFREECTKIGAEKILLEVRVSNARAIHFYRKNGFVRLGRRPRFYSDPVEDAFTMELRL